MGRTCSVSSPLCQGTACLSVLALFAIAIAVDSPSALVPSNTENGTAYQSRVVIEVDVSGFYAWCPFWDPDPALAVAYLIGDPELEVAAMVVSSTPSWLQQIVFGNACRAAQVLLAEMGRPEVPVVCRASGHPEWITSLKHLLSGDTGTNWLTLDSSSPDTGLATVLRSSPDLRNNVREAVILRSPEASGPLYNDVRTRLPSALTPLEAELASLLKIGADGGLPKLILLPRSQDFLLGMRDADSVRTSSSNAWFAKYSSAIKRFVWWGGHLQKFQLPHLPVPPDSPQVPGGRQRHGIHLSSLVAASAATSAPSRAQGLFKEESLVLEDGALRLSTVDQESGAPLLRVRAKHLGNRDVLWALAIDYLARIGGANGHDEL